MSAVHQAPFCAAAGVTLTGDTASAIARKRAAKMPPRPSRRVFRTAEAQRPNQPSFTDCVAAIIGRFDTGRSLMAPRRARGHPLRTTRIEVVSKDKIRQVKFTGPTRLGRQAPYGFARCGFK